MQEARVQKEWCVTKFTVSNASVQNFLDFACAQIDCRPINPGGACYEPNTYQNHGSYALDVYYNVRGICDTNTIARFVDNDPCIYHTLSLIHFKLK